MQSPLAAIDLGTNTARLLIGYRELSGAISPLLIKRQITRLGGGFSRESGISVEAQERTTAAMIDFAGEIRRHGAATIRAVATSAIRDAVNGYSLCAALYRETGISIEVIDGREEGLLTLRGVLAGLDDTQDDLLVFDVGGGSTEYTLTRGKEPVFTRSLPLGVVRLTEGKDSLAGMEDKIDRELARLAGELADSGYLPALDEVTLVGTAGTATSLAAISMRMTDYNYRLVNNYSLSLKEIRDIFAMLLPMKPEERRQVPGLERGREDLIVAGTMLTLRTMETFGFNRLKISDFGLLEGVFLSL